jgi:hypothetical protein
MADTTWYVSNILSVYARSNSEEKRDGRLWYPHANEIARDIAKGNIQIGAGVISALSPNKSWDENVKLATRVLKTHNFSSGTYGANLRKAKRISLGENPLLVLGGQKTIAFYVSILTSGEDTHYVTIDRHAISICLGRIATDKEREELRNTPKGRRIYQEYAEAYRVANKEVPSDYLMPSELQAITWLTWRREKREKETE